MGDKRTHVPVWAIHKLHVAKSVFKRAEQFWKSRVTGMLLIIASLSLVVYWQLYTPSPGKAVAALAVTAAIMTLRTEMNGVEKFLWMGVLFAFLFIEVRSIDKDRADNDTKQLAARAKLDQDFAGVLEQNQRAFNTTMGKMNGLAKLSSENLNEMSGGDTFCYFTANWSMGGGTPWSCPLMVYVEGRHPMRNVTAEISEIGKQLPPKATWDDIMSLFRPIPLGDGTLLPGLHMLSTGFRIAPGRYGIRIWGRNGFFNETMEFSLGSDGRPTIQNYEVWGHGKKLYPSSKQSSR